MRIKHQVTVFDTADLASESTFWAGVLGGTHAQVVGLSAVLLNPADDLDAVEGFQVYADPSGHPFCLCW
jgi:hypothetical protein